MTLGNSSVWYNNQISIKHINSEFNKNTKTLNVDDTCPICCDILQSRASERQGDLLTSESEIISCPECHNYVHKQCIKIWLEQSKTCVYCRSGHFKNYIKDNDV